MDIVKFYIYIVIHKMASSRLNCAYAMKMFVVNSILTS